MSTAVVTTRRGVLMLKHGHSGASGFGEVERRALAARDLDGGPFRKGREGGRREGAEFFGSVDDFPADDSEDGFNAFKVSSVPGRRSWDRCGPWP